MSCQLCILSKIKDVAVLRRFICKSNDENSTDDSAVSDNTGSRGWDNDWGWGEDAKEQSESESVDDSGWLHECEVSVSSLGDLLAIGKEDRLALLQVSYEEGDGDMFVVLWKRVISEFPKEAITSVFCLPIVSHKRSSEGSPEWTCIIVGFNTGHVRMYSEAGTKVLDQMIHNESVVSIKCKTYSPPRYPGSSDLSEELSILYETVLVALDGFGLFQTLRACKNRAAMAAASGSQQLELPPLGYKKWGLREQGQAFDHISAGTYTASPFDQLQSASIAGFREKISSVPPTFYVYACAGENPYSGVYHAIDGRSYRLLPDVTGLATELLSVGAAKLFSWGSSFLRKQDSPAEAENKKVKIEPATPVFRRFSIEDKRRIGHSICLSPCGRVAAVTDSLGRVVLIDINSGAIKRIWKGYRNAQVAWMTVKERPSSRHSIHRCAFFLIIYAPKRGILEVWLSDSGPRVGAFNVGKGCRLLYPGCSLLGVNSSTYKLVKGKIGQCFLLNSDGQLMNIMIPFHLALSDANSKGAHDRQLMSLAKAILKERDQDPQAMADALWEPVSKMKLTISFSIVIERLLKTNHITSHTALSLIHSIVELIQLRNKPTHLPEEVDVEDDVESAMDVESRLLLELCTSRKVLIDIYSSLIEFSNTKPDAKAADLSVIEPVSEVSTLLLLKVPTHSPKKVSFSDDSHLSLSDFLSLCQSQHSTFRFTELTTENMIGLGKLLFEPCLSRAVKLDQVKEMVSPLNMSVRFMLDCLLLYYLSLEHPSETFLPSLHALLSSLHQADNREPCIEAPHPSPPTTPVCDDLTPGLEYNEPKAPFPPTSNVPWSTYIRDVCEVSASLKGYLHIAIVCRSLCVKDILQLDTQFADVVDVDNCEGAPGADGAPGASDTSWEHLSVEVAMWNVSLKQLEHVIILNSLLLYERKCPHTGKDISNNTVTVAQLKVGNRGLVGELVGRWCVANMFSASDILIDNSKSFSEPNAADQSQAEHDDVSKTQADESTKEETKDGGHRALLRKARDIFPLSLTSDIVNANACWEYMSQWNKGVETLYNFKFALEYLKNVENGCLRHGICVMMWNTYLVKRVSWLVLLIEKVGKAPKDRLCKKEIDMDTATATEFIGIVCDFMSIFLQANCDYGEVVQSKVESLWSEGMTGHSLVQMACMQRETNYRLVVHHSLLITLVYAILVFAIKSVKIMSLFDHNGSKAFFADLHSHPYLPVEGKDEEVNANRKDFLCRVLQNCVQSLPDWELFMVPGGLINCDKDSDAMKWPVTVMDLATSFALDTDNLRNFYVQTLISHGHDMLALEVLPYMADPKLGYTTMFDVCCQRFSHYMFEADQKKIGEITSFSSPLLLNILNEKHEGNLASKNIPLADTNKLLLQIMRGLESSHPCYDHVQQLYKLIANFS